MAAGTPRRLTLLMLFLVVVPASVGLGAAPKPANWLKNEEPPAT